MFDINRIALITPIEENKVVSFNGNKIKRFFEDECIRCVEKWRKNGGWLKDIPIYVLNINNSNIQTCVIEKLQSQNVVYIEDFYDNSKNFKTGFLNEPYCGYYFEKLGKINQDVFIKIDLDMQLLKPIPEKMFEMLEEGVLIGQYDEKSAKGQRKTEDNTLPFDTNLIISTRNSEFYEKYFNLCFSNEILESETWKKLEKEYGSYYLEEHVVDYMFKNNMAKIIPVKNYQYGEGYPSISEYTDEEISKIMFLHEHIYENNKFPYDYNPIRERMAYMKRSKMV